MYQKELSLTRVDPQLPWARKIGLESAQDALVLWCCEGIQYIVYTVHMYIEKLRSKIIKLF